MSAGTFTDENGNVYTVSPSGKLIPVEGAATKQPSLMDEAKAAGKKAAAKQVENVVSKAANKFVEGAGGFGLGSALSGGGAATSTAAGAFSPATQAAWNSAAMGGATLPEVVPATGAFDLAGIGSAGNAILPAAGLATAYDLWANRPQNIGHGSGYLQGAASGAMMGSYFGPWGAGAGAGLGLLANAFGIGGKSRTKVEEEARDKLEEQGIVIPNSDIKEWENNAKFKESRNEADLTGKDIIHSASLYGIKGYDKLDPAKQEAIANEALKQKLVREHHGTIEIGMNDAYKKFVESQIGGATAGNNTGGTSPRSTPTQIRIEEDPKEKKRRQIAQIIPELESTPTKAPRYDINVSSLMSNPYL